MTRSTHIRYLLRSAIITLLALLPCGVMRAHGGEDHGEAKPAPPSAPGASASQLTTDAVTDQFELLLKYAPPVIGKNATLRFFLADYATNRPMERGTFSLSFKPAGVTIVRPPMMTSPGVYDATVVFPADTIYSLVATVNAEQRTDFMEVRNIYSGTHATTFLAEHSGAAQPGTSDTVAVAGPNSWWVVVAVILAVALAAALTMLFIRRKSLNRTSTITTK
ncbi:MAG: hypothetical protein ABI876_00170 [Bacteroidota bacterium]